MTFIENSDDLQLKRENDQFIMNAVLKLPLTPKQIRTINKCCIYLQVYTFSDLCSSDGFYLLPYHCKWFNPLSHFTDLEWPDQGPLPDRSW